MFKTYLRIFVTGFKQKSIQRHPICMTDANYYYILDEIEHHQKMSLNGMWVLIVTRNSNYGNNHNAILYVVVNFRIIYYLYVNVILFSIIVCFISLYSICTDGVIFILLKYELVPKWI